MSKPVFLCLSCHFRRTIFDDSRGVGEAIDEIVCADNSCKGLTVYVSYMYIMLTFDLSE